MKPVLVTAATGQVGRYVVKGLEAESVPVRALTRDVKRAEALFESLGVKNAEVVQGDFTDAYSLRLAAKDCGQLFLASADHADQIEMEMNVVHACLEAGDVHIVKLSSCDASAGAPYSWARNHVAVETQIVMRTTDNFSFLRPHFFMQNLFAFADEVRRASSISVSAADGKYGMIDARDIANSAVHVLLNEKPIRRTAELTGPEPTSFSDVTSALSSALKREIRYENISDEEHLRILTEKQNVSQEDAADIIRNYQDMRTGAFAVSTDEVERLTGTQPRSIKQFAVDFAAEFK